MNLSLKSGYVLRKGLKAFNQKDQFVITFKFIEKAKAKIVTGLPNRETK